MIAAGALAENDVSIVSHETLTILYFLLPGFVATWIFYGLTAHRKEDKFERVIQALIFTVIIKVLGFGVRKVWWVWLKHWWHPFISSDGYWTEEKELVCAVFLAVLVGIAFAACANWDAVHRVLRKLKVTKRTSYPSEWYSAFHRFKEGEVVLHLKSERRLKGWADEWSDNAERGHFIIQFPVWLDKEGNEYRQRRIERLVVPACEVEMIEFWYPDDKVAGIAEVLAADKQSLADLHKVELANEEQELKDGTTESNGAAEPVCATNGDE